MRFATRFWRLKIAVVVFSGLVLYGLLAAGQTNRTVRVSFQKGVLRVENDRVVRSFAAQREAGVWLFYPLSWRDRGTGHELLPPGGVRHWFEFELNGTAVRSENGGWKYTGYTTRRLENGGVELVIRLQGQNGHRQRWKGLEIRYVLQMFPGSCFCRERLELHVEKGHLWRLTKSGGQVHWIFPRYNFVCREQKKLPVREIHLAEWNAELLPEVNWQLRPNDRLQLKGGKSGRNLAQNHMYHPQELAWNLEASSGITLDGPVVLVGNPAGSQGWVFSYEHGAPGGDPDQRYLKIELNRSGSSAFTFTVSAQRGAYYDGQEIAAGRPYRSVWVDVGTYAGNDFSSGKIAFWNFVYRNLSEHLASRQPTIYYNTWGMQRDEQMEKKVKPQQVLTEKRVLREISLAHELGVDVFVIDDGWQQWPGDWMPDSSRFPHGLSRIRAKLDSLGMRLGLWFAAQSVDRHSSLYRQHPEWLVRDSTGAEVVGRWDRPIACFSSGYRHYFVDLCKFWIDHGVTYFKWDGLDKHVCYSPAHEHGGKDIPPADRAANSGYRFILDVTDAARQLIDYNPNVVIVYDVTEERRNVGLAFLSQSRFFWINNGATWYDDLSPYRSKSIRTVANLYHSLLPTVLQTSAVYPHQSEKYGAQHYNVNTTLLGGGGFWGDLSEMKPEDRRRVGEEIRLFKRVAPVTVATPPRVIGSVGASPEIYEFLPPHRATGMVVAFSGKALKMNYQTAPVLRTHFFCVLRNAYKLAENNRIQLPLLLPQPDATCEAFILENPFRTYRIESSSCWLRDARAESAGSFWFVNGAPGEQTVFWPAALGFPQVAVEGGVVSTAVRHAGDHYLVRLEEKTAGIRVRVFGAK